MSENDKKPKKRGRKPKVKPIIEKPIIKELNSEEEPLITHLSISLQDVLNNETEIADSTIEDSSIIDSDSIFLKQESKLLENDTETETNNELTELEKLEKEVTKLKYKIFKLTRRENIHVKKSNFNKNTKCWWCKNCFNSPSVGLPESYFNDKFYCTGNFCSYNCALAYNIDSNDNVWKKTSLLNLLYFKTYGLEEKIITAPDWRQLQDFGGDMTIDEFRNSSLVNNCDYTLLHPPLETRVHTFEKNYNIRKSAKSSSVYQKLLEDSDELVLKRSKPLKSTKYSLDKTLFIKKKKKRKERKMIKANNYATTS